MASVPRSRKFIPQLPNKIYRNLPYPVKIGSGIAILQFIILTSWEIHLWNRFSLTWDYSLYYQAVYLIAHGILNPYITFRKFFFYQNDFEIFIWILAVAQKIIPFSGLLLVLQSLAVSVSTLISFLWIVQITDEKSELSRRYFVIVASPIMLLFTPWIYWDISFDVHTEVLLMPVILMLSWKIWQGSIKGTMFWTFVAILGGQIAFTYIVGSGLAGIIRGRSSRYLGIFVVCVGILGLIVLEHIGLQGVSLEGFYGYLSHKPITSVTDLLLAAIRHRGLALHTLLSAHQNIYGAIAPEGVIGLLSPSTSLLSLIVVLENGLVPGGFWSSPQTFQSIPIVFFTTIGTFAVITRISARLTTRVTQVVLAVLCANTILWAIVWIPAVSNHWVRTSPKAAQQLQNVLSELSPSTEVVSSQGFAGRFAGRKWFYIWWSLNRHNNDYIVPLHTRRIVFLVSAYQGVEVSPVAAELARINFLSSLKGVKVLSFQHGIWAFSWIPPKHLKFLRVPGSVNYYGGWSLPGSAGFPNLFGSKDLWSKISNGKAGYIVRGLYFNAKGSQYKIGIRLSNTKSVTVEVWNTTDNKLLLRRMIPNSVVPRTLSFLCDIHTTPGPAFSVYRGWGPFSLNPPPAPNGNQIEVRVWTQSKNIINIPGILVKPLLGK